MKWDWTKVTLLFGLVVSCIVVYFCVTETKRKEVCPLGNDKLVVVIMDGKRITCVYTKEPLKTKKKYTKEMWNE